jgi:hypothetical protein
MVGNSLISKKDLRFFLIMLLCSMAGTWLGVLIGRTFAPKYGLTPTIPWLLVGALPLACFIGFALTMWIKSRRLRG